MLLCFVAVASHDATTFVIVDVAFSIALACATGLPFTVADVVSNATYIPFVVVGAASGAATLPPQLLLSPPVLQM